MLRSPVALALDARTEQGAPLDHVAGEESHPRFARVGDEVLAERGEHEERRERRHDECLSGAGHGGQNIRDQAVLSVR
jgi:hypothetical protein